MRRVLNPPRAIHVGTAASALLLASIGLTACGGSSSTTSISEQCAAAMQASAAETLAGGYSDTAFQSTVHQCGSADEWIAAAREYPEGALYSRTPSVAQARDTLETLCLSEYGPACE